MLRIIKIFSRSFWSKPKEVSLGRWEHRIDINQVNVKVDLANEDHCGDRLCGTFENKRISDDHKDELCCLEAGFNKSCDRCVYTYK